jgi:acetoin:2,6-dichlorophenolindophenol oxidoreductase subunit beta
MAKLMYSAACSVGIEEEMARDERVFMMGEDVRISMMGRSNGLLERFGEKRVRNTPISEAGVVGAAVGAAATGLVPVVDLLMANFVYVCMDQLMNNANKLRYMMGGSSSFPLTLLASTGAAGSLAAQHSDSPHAQLINGGGFKVLLPTTSADAKGLVKSAIRDPNPVIVFMPFVLSGIAGEVPDEEDYLVPIGKGRVVREGTDVSVVAIGAMILRALEAAEQLEEAGISVEVIDPRTLHPFDYDTVITSVEKTGRLVCVDEARRSCSLASEIVARVSAEAFGALKAAPRVVANPDVHVPYAPILEAQVIPQTADVVAAVQELLPAAVTR